jgi:uncharacterized membrane protein YfcA
MSALLVAAGTGVAAGALLQSATGFGFSLVAAPLMFAAVEPEQAVGMMIVLGLEVNVLTLASEGRRPRPLWRHCGLLLAWAAPGALAGVAVLRALSPVALQAAVTGGVLGTLAARRLAGRHLHMPAFAAGFTAGALTTSTTTSGPPLLLYLLGRGAEPARVRDSLTACFVGLSALGAVALLVTGTPAVPDAALVAALLPAAAVGHLAGRRVFARLAAGGSYEPVLTGTLVLAVLISLASVLL